MIPRGAVSGAKRTADSWRGASESGRLRTAPPLCSRPVRLSGVPSRRPSRSLDEPVGVMQPAEDGGAHDVRTGRQSVPVGLGLDGKPVGRIGNPRPEACVGAHPCLIRASLPHFLIWRCLCQGAYPLGLASDERRGG